MTGWNFASALGQVFGHGFSAGDWVIIILLGIILWRRR